MSWNRTLLRIAMTLIFVGPLILSACGATSGETTTSPEVVADTAVAAASADSAVEPAAAALPEDCADAGEDCCEGEVVPDCCPHCGEVEKECDCSKEPPPAAEEDCGCDEAGEAAKPVPPVGR